MTIDDSRFQTSRVAVFLVAIALVLVSCGATETVVTSVDNAASAGATDATDSTTTDEAPTPDVVDRAVEAGDEAAEAAEAAADNASQADDSSDADSSSEADNTAEGATTVEPTPTAESDSASRGEDFTQAEIDCLEEDGFNPFDLLTAGLNASSGQVGDDEEAVYNSVFRCAPEWALSDAFVSEFTAGLNDGTPGLVSEGEGRCVVQELIDSGSGGSVLFGRDPEATVQVFESCLTPENAAEFFGGPGTGPQTYGDDPAFDLLQDTCLSDDKLNDVACDVLYFNSSQESDYEALALTCGDRTPFSDITCTDDMVDENGDLFVDPDSAGIPAVEESCRGGQMIACDFLYSLTEFGSSTEQLGGTCGERGAFDGATLCVERFGENAG